MLRRAELPTFLSALRLNGFTIGIPEQQRVLDLLLSLEAAGTMPDNSEQLSNMLGAVLCRSAQQQAQFRRQFVNHFGTWEGRRPSRDTSPIEIEPLVAVVSAANSFGGAAAGAPALRRQIAARAGIIVLVLAGLFAIAPMLKIGDIAPTPRPLPTPSSPNPFFQLLRDWLISTLAGPAAVIEAMQTTFGPATLLLVYFAFIAAALWVAAPSRPFAAYVSRRRVEYRPQLVQLLIKPLSYNPFLDGNFARGVQDLRRPRLVQSRELDVDASLSTTLDHGGLFSPVFTYRRVAPEYLVLIDRKAADDLAARYAESLVAALREMHVYVDLYYYNGDFRWLSAGVGLPSITFEEATGRHAEHRLVMIGTGEQFFDPVTGRLHPWAALVKSFQRRILLTPTPRELWGYREEALQLGLETAIVRIDRGAIAAMSEQLAKEDPPRPAAPKPGENAHAFAMAKLADLLDDRPLRWIEDGMPDDAALADLDRALRQGMSPAEYDWLSACAVYPEVNWQLTVHLGQALPSAPLRRREALLDLVVLPWFRFARMPSWLREQLVTKMPTALYRDVHKVLETLLLTTLAPVSGKHPIEAALDRPAAPADSEAVESRLARSLRDSVLIDFMTRIRKERTVVKLPQAIARLLKTDSLLRNIFSRQPQEDVEASAQIVASEVEALGLEAFDIRPIDEAREIGAELRQVAQTFDRTGARIEFEGRLLHLSTNGCKAGTAPGRR